MGMGQCSGTLKFKKLVLILRCEQEPALILLDGQVPDSWLVHHVKYIRSLVVVLISLFPDRSNVIGSREDDWYSMLDVAISTLGMLNTGVMSQ